MLCAGLVTGSAEPGSHTAVAAVPPTGSAFPTVPDYPVPDGALFVSPAGSDDAAGTKAAPLRTLGAAIRKAPSGATVVLRAGTYREASGVVRRRITIQPYPGERVELKGSVVVDDWRPRGEAWEHRGEPGELCTADCYLPGIIDPDHPMAGRPEMVFVDGKPLRQVAAITAVRPGTFYGDGGHVVIGTDPRGRKVEVTRYEQLLRFDGADAAGSVLRGLRIVHYGARQHYGALGAAVVVNSPRVRVEANRISWAASTGLAVYQPDAVVSGNSFNGNGLTGLQANRADDILLVGNRFKGNNAERFTLSGEAIGAAGAKVTRTPRAHVEGNRFIANYATGWWCDLGCTDATVVGNVAEDNAVHGLYYEVSSRALVAGNRIVGNRKHGVKLSSADHVKLERNTFLGNRISLGLYNDKRSPESDWYSSQQGLPWLTFGTEIIGNRFVQRGHGEPFIRRANYRPEGEEVPPMVSRDHGNTYRRAAS